MDKEAAEALQARLEHRIRAYWSAQDPDVQVSSLLHADGRIDLTVVSRLFADKDGLEREAFFWPVFAPVPKSELIQMTYCLLLTPEEAARHFALSGPPQGQSYHDDWDD